MAAAVADVAALSALVAAAVLLLAAFVSLALALLADVEAALAEDAEAAARSLLYKAQLLALCVFPVVLDVSAAPSGEAVDVAHALAVLACVPALFSDVLAAPADVAAALALAAAHAAPSSSQSSGRKLNISGAEADVRVGGRTGVAAAVGCQPTGRVVPSATGVEAPLIIHVIPV